MLELLRNLWAGLRPLRKRIEPYAWLIPAAAYLLAVLVVLLCIPLNARLNSGYISLARSTEMGWIWLLLAIPAAAGLLMQFAGRRFWAWPYVYLLVLLFGLNGTTGDNVDQAYFYASLVGLTLTIALAEILGLSLGRWVHRAAAMAYFPAAALWLLGGAIGEGGKEGSEDWRFWTFALAGVLFIFQALIQLAKYLQKTRREQKLEDGAAPGATPATPHPQAGESEPPGGEVQDGEIKDTE